MVPAEARRSLPVGARLPSRSPSRALAPVWGTPGEADWILPRGAGAVRGGERAGSMAEALPTLEW